MRRHLQLHGFDLGEGFVLSVVMADDPSPSVASSASSAAVAASSSTSDDAAVVVAAAACERCLRADRVQLAVDYLLASPAPTEEAIVDLPRALALSVLSALPPPSPGDRGLL